MAEWTDDFGTKLVDVHEQWQCMKGNCTIHKPSDHRMRSFKQRWRNDRALMERVCEHGIGHPDPDEIGLDESGRGVHGCDGCCLEVMEIESVNMTDAQELIIKVLKNDGGYTERQRTLEILASLVEEHEDEVARDVIGEAIERIIAKPVGE